MKNTLAMLLLGLVPVLSQQTVFASPEDDRKAFVEYFQSRFPDVPFAEFANGIYAIDEDGVSALRVCGRAGRSLVA
jgi:sulfur-oxidizing protein SoxA